MHRIHVIIPRLLNNELIIQRATFLLDNQSIAGENKAVFHYIKGMRKYINSLSI